VQTRKNEGKFQKVVINCPRRHFGNQTAPRSKGGPTVPSIVFKELPLSTSLGIVFPKSDFSNAESSNEVKSLREF
jgi:hypothetical protein